MNYRGCVGAGGMYGDRPANPSLTLPAMITILNTVDSNALIGAFGSRVAGPAKGGQYTDPVVPPNRLSNFTDGTSQTLLISECIVPHVPDWGGPIGSTIYGNMGGGLFPLPKRLTRLRPMKSLDPARNMTWFQKTANTSSRVYPLEVILGQVRQVLVPQPHSLAANIRAV